MTDDRAGMFAPIGGIKPAAIAAAAKGEQWTVIVPVPDGAPAPPAKHYRHGKPARTEIYRDAEGRRLGYVLRFDLGAGNKEFMPLTFCENAGGRREWRWKSWPEPRPLYGLDRLAQRPDAPVIVCEGEKSADAASKLLPSYVAVTSPNGSQSAKKAQWSDLAGRHVVIWPDADEAGRKYADDVAAEVAPIAASLRVVEPPTGSASGWDADDAAAAGWDTPRAALLIDGARHPSSPTAGGDGERRRRPPQSDGLLELLDGAELWHTPEKEAHATIAVVDHQENWPIRSKAFRLWMAGRYFESTGGAPSSQATEDAMRVLEGRALFEGPEHPAFLRIGELAGDVYVDLGDDRWQVVKITPHGWAMIAQAPVKFVRSSAMKALPMPEPGGAIEELRELVNVRGDADFTLLVAWLVGAFHPRGPYPILALNGEQGSAKSTLSKLLRSLVDPNMAPIRSAPRDEQSLVIGARNAWMIAFDNLSDVPGWLSDSLCRLSTGGGFSARELFTDYGEIIVQVSRAILINGIPDLASRPDLADRAIHVTLPAIPEERRRSEAEYEAVAAEKRPRILGALLDAVSGALRHRDRVPPRLTRMADFVTWICAAESSLGWEEGEFLDAYTGNRAGAVEGAIEADPVGEAVRRLVAQCDWPPLDPNSKIKGSPTELLAALELHVSDATRKSRIWPAANKLRGRLRRLQAPLRSVGIVLDLDHRANDADRTRLIGIRRPER